MLQQLTHFSSHRSQDGLEQSTRSRSPHSTPWGLLRFNYPYYIRAPCPKCPHFRYRSQVRVSTVPNSMSGCLLNFSEWLAPSELAIRSDYNTDEHPVSIGPKLLSPSLVSSSTEPKLIFSSTHYFDVMIQTQITRELSSTSQDITEPPVPDLLQQVYECVFLHF